MSKLKWTRPSPALVVSVIALIVALAGTAYAAHRINGGSSDTELKELAVKPTRVPCSVTVETTVTPVGKVASALRKPRRSDIATFWSIDGSTLMATARPPLSRISSSSPGG